MQRDTMDPKNIADPGNTTEISATDPKNIQTAGQDANPPAMDTPNTIRRKRVHSVTPPQKTNDIDPQTKGFVYRSPSDQKDAKRKVITNSSSETVSTINFESITTHHEGDQVPNDNGDKPTVTDPVIPTPTRPGAPTDTRRTRSMSKQLKTTYRSRSLDTRTSKQKKDKEKEDGSDILSTILLNMQNELKTTTNTIVGKIDAKIDGLKVDFATSLTLVKDNIDCLNTDVSNLSENQTLLGNRLAECQRKVSQNAEQISSINDQNIINVNEIDEHIVKVEAELASDIETLKLNIEDKFAERNETLDTLKTQLEHIQNDRVNEQEKNRSELEKLYEDFLELKNQITKPNQNQNPTSKIKSNMQYHQHRPGTSPDPKIEQTNNTHTHYSASYRAKASERVERLKNIVVDGLYENPTEELKHVIAHMCSDIGCQVTLDQISQATRIGPPNPSRRWPRPVRVTLTTENTRMDIYDNRDLLPQTRLFHNIRINADEPKEVRVNRARLRQAAQKARDNGKKVLCGMMGIQIDGVSYNIENIDQIPSEFVKSPENKNENSTDSNINSDQHSFSGKPFRIAKRRLKDGRTRIEMVGPCLQKTRRGLAFLTEKCFLSNFYKCNVRYNGCDYKTSEHCWQAQKAIICNDPLALAAIKEAAEPLDAKRIGEQIVENEHWRRIKIEKMYDILQHKFRQNRDLYYKLINTRPYHLIEASFDGFWGAGCNLYSQILIDGTWTGKNTLGCQLVNVRTDLIREEETTRLHTPPKLRGHHNTTEPGQGHIQMDISEAGTNNTRL